MKTNKLRIVTSVGLTVALWATSLQAQQSQLESDQSSQQTQQRSAQQEAASEASKQELKVSQKEMSEEITDANKASRLIGMHVKNKEGEDLGKIKDLAVDAKQGRIAYAVLSTGGFLGVSEKYVAIPFQALTPQPGENHLVIDLPKQKLEQAPGFAKNNWPGLNAVKEGKTIGLAGSDSAGQEVEEAAGAENQKKQQQEDEQKQQEEQKQPQQQPDSSSSSQP